MDNHKKFQKDPFMKYLWILAVACLIAGLIALAFGV